jgi:hypothetical protein
VFLAIDVVVFATDLAVFLAIDVVVFATDLAAFLAIDVVVLGLCGDKVYCVGVCVNN